MEIKTDLKWNGMGIELTKIQNTCISNILHNLYNLSAYIFMMWNVLNNITFICNGTKFMSKVHYNANLWGVVKPQC